MIIGEINSIAIEVNRTSPRFGHFRLWIKNQYVGAIEDENILGIYKNEFEIFIKSSFNNERFAHKNLEEILFSDTEGLYDSMYFMNCEGFDDVNLKAYHDGEWGYFFWHLFDEPFFEYPDYPKGIQKAKVKLEEVVSLYNQYKDYLEMDFVGSNSTEEE